jgi:hypothetical protein
MTGRALPIAACTVILLVAATSAGAYSSGGFTPQRPLPNPDGQSFQADAEPGLAIARDGQVWVGTDLLDTSATRPDRVLGSDVYTSVDGGRTYRWVAQPISPAAGLPGPGGEDTDIAVAPARNAEGHYTVYVASLSVANSSLAWSTDGGVSWHLTPVSGLPVEDRPWLAADGPCTVYVAYHSPLLLPTDGSSTQVTRLDTCDPTMSRVATVVGGDADTAVGGLDNPQFGKLVVDTSPTSRFRHAIYLPMQQCHAPTGASLSEDLRNSAGGVPTCGAPSVNLIAVSTDGGTTFTVRKVSDGARTMAIWPVTVATGASGTLYYAWTDSVHSYLNTSRDGGLTWTRSARLDTGLGASTYPTVTALGNGRVDVAMFATQRSGNANASTMGAPGSAHGAPWRVWVARSVDGGHTFRLIVASDVVHRGVLCTLGSACPSNGSRGLLDDFGAALSPQSGRLSIAFTSDLLRGRVVPSYTAYVTER